MNSKKDRQEAIRRILVSRGGSTQDEIRMRLSKMGIGASQSSLSRDLREMGAVKVPVEGGALYRLSEQDSSAVPGSTLAAALREFCLGIEEVGTFIVIRTTPANASDLCLVIDRQDWHEIVGTLAGDDTILVITRSDKDMRSLKRRLNPRRVT